MPDFLPAAQLSVSKPITGQGAAEAAIAAQVPVQRSPDGLFNFNARFVSSQPGQAVHAASMVELQGGRLRAVWFSGSREGAGDVTIQTSVMNPETLNWSEETTLFNRRQLQQDLWRYVKKLGNPVIARMTDESLMICMVNVSIGGWAGSSITWARSTDEGTSWSTPRRLVTSPFLNISTLVKGAPLFYANGHFGLPVYHEFVTKFSEVLRINAQGQVVDKTRIPGSQTSLQPVILVTGSSNAQMYMRSSSSTAVMMSTTGDAGQTWSFTQPTRNANPDSALAGVVTGTGQQWLALNPSRKNREVLALLRASATGSFDGVRPWIVEATPAPEKLLSVIDYERLLSRELRTHGASEMQIQAYVGSAKRQLCGTKTCVQEFSYPYLLQSQDGYLHLIYTWHRSRIKHIRLDPFQVLSFNGAEPPGVHVASFAY
ncbi:MAG: BNR/Asp-box repeat protein [Polaromonas sp.]|nr:BNR/Asp-box repeat protein [Polaromonas sp.]